MAKSKLTTKSVARLASTVGEHVDAQVAGLALRVRPSGATAWVLNYRLRGRRRRWTIGTHPTLSLADARTEGQRGRREIEMGRDPGDAKKEAREADTFGELADAYIEGHAKRKKRTWRVDQRFLDRDVLPLWRHRSAKEITRRDVRAVIDDVVDAHGEITANRLRATLHKLFNFALATDVVDVNPVAGTERPGQERQRDRVLSDDEIRTLWAALDALEDQEMAAGFKLRLVTAQRGGEVFGMKWADVDLVGAMWTIPATDAKNKLAHRVPLSSTAIDIIKGLRTRVDEEMAAYEARTGKAAKEPVFVVAGARGKRQRAEAAATFGVADFVGHDLRRTAASRMASAGVPRLVISKILNHVEKGVTAVYDRHSYDAEKRVALDTWARLLTSILERTEGATVLAFARG